MMPSLFLVPGKASAAPEVEGGCGVVVWHGQCSAGGWCRSLHEAEVDACGVGICCPLLGIAGKLCLSPRYREPPAVTARATEKLRQNSKDAFLPSLILPKPVVIWLLVECNCGRRVFWPLQRRSGRSLPGPRLCLPGVIPNFSRSSNLCWEERGGFSRWRQLN